MRATNSYDFALARYLTNGDLDPEFDGFASGNGIIRTDIGNRNQEIRGIALQSTGKIIVAGFTHDGSRQ